MADRHIQMPDDDEFPYIMNGLYRIAGLPSIMGAVDCTHIAIQAPTVAETHCTNRKGYHFNLRSGSGRLKHDDQPPGSSSAGQLA